MSRRKQSNPKPLKRESPAFPLSAAARFGRRLDTGLAGSPMPGSGKAARRFLRSYPAARRDFPRWRVSRDRRRSRQVARARRQLTFRGCRVTWALSRGSLPAFVCPGSIFADKSSPMFI